MPEKKQKISFNYNDAWFFLTIAIFSNDKYKPIDWGDILAIGDGLNHAVFTPNEITNALKKLLATGLIDINGNRIRLTNLGMKLKNKCATSIKKCHKILNGITHNDLFEKTSVDDISLFCITCILMNGIHKHAEQKNPNP